MWVKVRIVYVFRFWNGPLTGVKKLIFIHRWTSPYYGKLQVNRWPTPNAMSHLEPEPLSLPLVGKSCSRGSVMYGRVGIPTYLLPAQLHIPPSLEVNRMDEVRLALFSACTYLSKTSGKDARRSEEHLSAISLQTIANLAGCGQHLLMQSKQQK